MGDKWIARKKEGLRRENAGLKGEQIAQPSSEDSDSTTTENENSKLKIENETLKKLFGYCIL
jgi:hypothetical protein